MHYYLRFHLALLVALDHLLPSFFTILGTFAVPGFYVISGYVITRVLNDRYWKLDGGFRKFWINRALRLAPSFFVASFLGFLLAALAPSVSSTLGVGIVLPNSADGAALLTKDGFDPSLWPMFYIPNILLIGSQSPFVWESPIQFAPGAWSLNIEIYYYLVLSLGAAGAVASRRFFALSLVLLAMLGANLFLGRYGLNYRGQGFSHLSINDWMMFYKSFFGLTFFFALGALCHFTKKFVVSSRTMMILAVVTLAFPFIAADSMGVAIAQRVVFGVLVAIYILSFEDWTENKFVKFLGDLAYPIFLINWFSAGLVLSLTSLDRDTLPFLLASLSLTFLLSSAIVVLVERPVGRLRARFRH